MLILCVALILVLLTSGVMSGGRKRSFDREDLAALRQHYEKIHREEALPFD